MLSDYGSNGPIGLQSGRYDYYILKNGLDPALALPDNDVTRDAQIAAALIAAQSGETAAPTIYNTRGSSTLRGYQVAGFVEWANRIDAALTARGKTGSTMAYDPNNYIYITLMYFDDQLSNGGTNPGTPTQDNTKAGNTSLKAGNTAWQSRFQTTETRFTALGAS